MDAAGVVYIADSQNYRLRKVVRGTITTFAGNGGAYWGEGGPATLSMLSQPSGVAADAAGNFYIADGGDNVIRKVAANGTITTVAGNGIPGYSGDGGQATAARLRNPFGVALGPGGNLYIADSGNNRIRIVAANGTITTVAGSASQGYSGDGGPATSAALASPYGIAVDAAGVMYISDRANNRVRKVASDHTITTLAGNGTAGYSGDGGLATGAKLQQPEGVAVDTAGNVYIADTGNNVVRMVSPDLKIAALAGNGIQGYSGDAGPAVDARLATPNGVTVDAAGNVFIADTGNNAVRMVAPNHTIRTIAGNGTFGYSGDGGLATAAEFESPAGVAVDPTGKVYIADLNNNVVRLLTGALLSATKTHSGNFVQGQHGATYSVVLRNAPAAAPTNGLVTVTETAPAGLTLTSMIGSGWTCLSNTCTRSDALSANSSYPAITVTVDVAANAASSVTNQVSVSGGNSPAATATDPTTILSAPAAPVLVSPANGAVGVTASALVWTASSGATSYDVYLGTSSSPPLAGNTTNTTFPLGTLSPGTTYYWRIAATNASGSTSSATWSFVTQAGPPPAPVLSAPGNGATGVSTTPVLSWIAAAGAASYDVYFGTAASPALAANTTGTSYSPGTLTASTQYYWRVVAKNAAGSNTSATWSFVTQAGPLPAPVLSAPANGVTGVSTAPVLSWIAAAGATSYDVYFGTPASPALAANTTGTSYSPGTLTASTQYYWRVVAKNAVGSNTSATWSFVTQAGPPPPVLIAPTNGATAASTLPVLSWNASSGATSYDIYLGTSPSPALAWNTTNTSYTPVVMSQATQYYWRVVAKNAAGSSSSATWSFMTPITPPSAPVLSAPGDRATAVSVTPVLSWIAAGGATSYDVYFGTLASQPLATNTTATSYSPGTLTVGTRYYWQVVAKNAGGSTNSAVWSFTTEVPAPQLLSPVNGATGVLLAPTLLWTATPGATSYDVYLGTQASPPLVTNTTATSYTPGTLNAGALYFWRVVAREGASASGSAVWSFTTPTTPQQPAALRFVPVTPCRVADTRADDGPFGGPSLEGASQRSFAIPQGPCGIPATAVAYSLNVTAVPEGPLSYLTLWPTGQDRPVASTLNSWSGAVVANAAIVPAGVGGAVTVYVTNPTDVILDIDGYFDTSNGSTSYAFYPAAPCRTADTRAAAGTFGGPSMHAGQSRDFPIPLGACGIPATARAYSLNVTAVPDPAHHYLGYLTTWPTGGTPPLVSTLNSWTGKVVANAAIVPAGTNESISVFVSDPTDLILDVNGYFGQPGNPGALWFYPVTPCRVADTRAAAGPFGGPEMEASATRSFAVSASACNIPSTAAAYSLNVTVVPDGPLAFLTAWPAGSPRPLVSTLNSFDGTVVANAAIVPAGAGGGVSVFVTGRTHVILDINGYFAQ